MLDSLVNTVKKVSTSDMVVACLANQERMASLWPEQGGELAEGCSCSVIPQPSLRVAHKTPFCLALHGSCGDVVII